MMAEPEDQRSSGPTEDTGSNNTNNISITNGTTNGTTTTIGGGSAETQQQREQQDQLSSLCSSLQVTAAAANDGLRDLLVSAPQMRDTIVKLSHELIELQTASRLYIRHSSVAEAAPGSDADVARGGDPSIPLPVLTAVAKLVRCALDITADIMDVLDLSETTPGNAAAARRRLAGRTETIGPRLVEVTTPAELARTALNLGLDAMTFGPAPSQGDESSDLPPYQSTQLLHDTLQLRMRLLSLELDGESQTGHLRTVMLEFIDHLQSHVGRSSSSLPVPLPQGEGNNISDVSSMHSEAIRGSGQLPIPDPHFTNTTAPNPAASAPPSTPAYDPVNVNHPAPVEISVRHLIKRDVSLNEIAELRFTQRRGRTVVATCTMDTSTRFYDLDQGTSINSVTQHGFRLTFPDSSADSNLWAYVTEDDSYTGGGGYNPWQTNETTFHKPVVIIGDQISAKKLHKLRWGGVRPLCFSRDGSQLAVTSVHHRIGLINTATNASISQPPIITTHTEEVTHALFTPDSHALVSVSRDGTIRLTDSLNLEPLAKLDTGTYKKPTLLGVTPDSDVVVSVWGDLVYRWNHATGGIESFALGSRRSREGWPVALSPDCRFLACRTVDGVDISDAHSGAVLFTIRFQSGFITAAAFSEDGRYLALGKAVANVGLKVSKSTLDIWEIVY